MSDDPNLGKTIPLKAEDGKPERLFTSCTFGVEDAVSATGNGRVDVCERFTISANGQMIDMIVTSVRWPPMEWTAQDFASWSRQHMINDFDRRDLDGFTP